MSRGMAVQLKVKAKVVINIITQGQIVLETDALIELSSRHCN